MKAGDKIKVSTRKLLSLCRQPLNNLVDICTLECTYWEYHPWRFHNIIELQFIDKFCFPDMWRNINLIRQNQHRGGSNTSVIKQFVQFFLCDSQFLGSSSIDHIQNYITTLCVAAPFASILFLTACIESEISWLVILEGSFTPGDPSKLLPRTYIPAFQENFPLSA